MDTLRRRSSDSWRLRSILSLLLLCTLFSPADAQMNGNNCGNNCCGCGVTFPDPPPIILQPPAPPPNNTCCCDCCGNNGGGGNGAFNGNCGGCGSNYGNAGGGGCCGGNGGGGCCDCCCGGNGGGGGCCCGGGGNNCCCPQPLTNQNPNSPGGPQSRTNRCCQVICTKCCNCCGGGGGGNAGGNGGGCCCQPCCCQPCCCGGGNGGGGGGCCQPCCCGQLCSSFCTPCCCNPCSCCDCCHDCYPNDFDCEIGYKRRRRRQIFAPHPAAAFHRFRTYPRRFYVLPLPLPTAHDDLPPRARGPSGRRSHTHHHFHHHFFHCCPCSCCSCANGQTGPGFNAQNCGGSNCGTNCGSSSTGNNQNFGPNFADHGQPQWPAFGPQQEGCFGSSCSQPPAEPQPCTLSGMQQQDFYNNFGSGNEFGSNNGFGSNFGSNFAGPQFAGSQFTDCPGCGSQFGGGFRRFQRLLLRRKRQLVTPAFNGNKVLNFLIPMFYKKPVVDEVGKEKATTTKCSNKRASRLFPCPLPIQPSVPPNDFLPKPLPLQNPCSNGNRDNISQMGDESNRQCCCQCCACPANKKKRRRRKKK